MDKIQEFILQKDTAFEQSFSMPKNSHVLSTRLSEDKNTIIVDILVDQDNVETINKIFHIFNQYSLIEDNIKANFIGTVVDDSWNEVFYVFEKIR